MSFSEELLADNSLDACDLAVASILQNDEANLQYGESLLNQLDEFTLSEMTLNPSGSTEETISENSKLVENDSNKSRGRKRKTKHIKGKETETKVWKCQECSKQFNQQCKLIRHLYSHSDKKNFMCEVCGKAFRQQSALCQHRVVHSRGKPYTCKICHKFYNRVSTLITHRKIHEEEKSYQCPHCPKAFHQKANLRNHIFTHTKEQPYKCGICGKGFNQSSNLATHKLKVHANKTEQRFHCQFCGKSFKKRANCLKHEQNDHGERMEEPRSKSTTDNSIMADSDCDDVADLPEDTIKIAIDPIKTDAMLIAQALNQQPRLVLVKPLDGSPAVARVEEDGEQQIIVPIKWTDLCPYTQIINSTESEREQDNPDAIQYKVQIKIPIVATMQEAPADEEVTAIVSDGDNETR